MNSTAFVDSAFSFDVNVTSINQTIVARVKYNDTSIYFNNTFTCYSGVSQIPTCNITTCSGHGSCSLAGNCICQCGYTGPNCKICQFTGAYPKCLCMCIQMRNFPLPLFLGLNPGNNHYYYLESTATDFTTAISNGLTWLYPYWTLFLDSFNDYTTVGSGISSYLATITSEKEHNFIIQNFPGIFFWISGTDYDAQGMQDILILLQTENITFRVLVLGIWTGKSTSILHC